MIILIGVALALSQFTSIKRFATGVLASTAVLGIIIGFAGRQVIANLVSGVLLAFTQPIRIGDLVSIGDEVHGRVTDVALTYTRVDAGDGSLIVVPNEKVATDVVVNHSAGNSSAPGDRRRLVTPGRRRGGGPRDARARRGDLRHGWSRSRPRAPGSR